MKKLAVVLVALGSLSGCVVYPVGGGRDYHRGYNDHYGSYRYDRDGVPDRYDRRPDNPRRY